VKYEGVLLEKAKALRDSENYRLFIEHAKKEYGHDVTGMFRAENGRAVCINCRGHVEGTASGRYRCDDCGAVAIKVWML